MKEYAERNRVLREMGFETYWDYLSSDLWWSIRARVFKRSKKCFVCDRRATQCHHASYAREVLDGTKIKKRIFRICRSCHEDIEFDSNGKKLSPSASTTRMHNLRAQRGAKETLRQFREVRIETSKLKCDCGKYLGNDVLDVGDWVLMKAGWIGRVEAIRTALRLPRFLIKKKCRGPEELKAKLVPK